MPSTVRQMETPAVKAPIDAPPSGDLGQAMRFPRDDWHGRLN
jgi:hypothetical protein